MPASSRLRRFALAALTVLATPAAWAQIMIGQSADFSGPVSASVKELTDGARLYFDAVNAGGGVHGQKLELVSLDDKFDPAVTAQNAKTLIDRNVVALFLVRGTPHAQAVLPLLAEHKVPLVAPSTGAMLLHEPVNRYIFNVRATYQREAERAVRHLSLIGMDRIAVLHVDDTFGQDAVQGAQRGFAGVSKKPVVLDKFDRTKPDFAPLVQSVVKADAQAVLIIGTAVAVSGGTKALREAGSKAQVVTLSNNAAAGFIKMMGEHARGTIVSQIFPYERSLQAPIVKEASDLARARGAAEVTPQMLEGFASAKVLVEGLRRAGASPSRARLQQALEGMRKVDIGGLEVSYSPTDHTGLDYADLSIIGPDGKFRR